MRIAIVSKADEHLGGASRIACELASGLLQRGIQTTHFIGWGNAAGSAWRRPMHEGVLRTAAEVLVRKASCIAGFQETFSRHHSFLRRHLLEGKFDLVHYHDVSYTLYPDFIREMSAHLPAVWSLHDFAGITGGCIFPEVAQCTQYIAGCRRCPQHAREPISSPFVSDVSPHFQSRKSLHATGLVTAIVPSAYCEHVIRTCGWFRSRLLRIPHPLDTNTYAPGARNAARQALRLPGDKPVVLLSSVRVDDVRKGAHFALAAIRRCGFPLTVCVVGGRAEGLAGSLPPGCTLHPLGYVSDPRKMADVYRAADVYLYPSLAETFSLQIHESIACGTPVVAFSNTAITEAVRHGVTGHLAPDRDVQGLVDGLRNFLAPSAAPRPPVALADRDWSLSGFVDRHLDVYRESIRRFDNPPPAHVP